MNILNTELDANNPNVFFSDLLRIMGGLLDVSRCYIFEYCDNTNTMSNTYEWTRSGIKPQIEKLQNIPIQLIAFWHECMIKQQIINYTDVNDIPSFPENQALIEQGIKSILIIPIHIDGKYYGFLGIDECSYRRSWTQLEVDFMIAMAAFIKMLFEKYVQVPTGFCCNFHRY